MKFLYCIFTIFVAANAKALPLTRGLLENRVDLILNNTEHASKKIDKLISDAQNAVEKKLLEHEEIRKLESFLKEKENETIYEKQLTLKWFNCFIINSRNFKNLVVEINRDLLHKLIVGRFKKTRDFANRLKKKVFDVLNVLSNHADREIKTCLHGIIQCKLTGEFLSMLMEYSAVKSTIEPSLREMIDSSDEYFNSVDIRNKIVTELTHPTYECMDVQKY